MATVPDLSHVPVVDNHCHAIQVDPPPSRTEWRATFTEGAGPRTRQCHVRNTVAYQRILGELAARLGVAADEESVFAARQGMKTPQLARDLLSSAAITALLLDDGFPPPPVFDLAEHADFVTGRAYSIHRIEPVIEALVFGTELDADDIATRLQLDIRTAKAAGVVALKSAIAYRSGLDVRVWTDREVRESLAAARSRARTTGVARLNDAPLHDTLLRAALEEAARLRLPVQFHVGYGDNDIDMRVAGPEHLRPLFEDDSLRDVPFVLLHECYPFTAVGAWLSAVYDNVWLDLSYAIPLLSRAEMLAFTRSALAVAPWSKLMVSSDGIKVPEFHWSGAVNARAVVARALAELVDDGDLRTTQLENVAAALLHGTAMKVYSLP